MSTTTLYSEKEKAVLPQLRFPEFKGDWEKIKLGKLAEKIGDGLHGTPIYSDDSDICFINGNNLTNGKIEITDKTKKVDYAIFKKNDKSLNENTILISLNGTIGNIAKYNNEKVMLGKSVGYFNFKENTNFYFHVFHTDKIQNFFISELTGSTIKNLSLKTLRGTIFPFPSLPEQQKIASFLSAVDEKIQQLSSKKELLEKYKKGLMQQLFSGKLRFKDDNGKSYADWVEKKLGYFIEEFKENSTENNQFEVLTSSNKGLMKQSDYFGQNRLTNRVNLGFNVIPSGYLTYRSRSDNRKFSFNENKLGITGLISTYYPVFKLKNSANNFFIELTNQFQNHIGKFSVGTSQTVLSYNELKKIKFKFPCDEEQQKIANFLSNIDIKIENTNQEINQMQSFKKGLLQQMFV